MYRPITTTGSKVQQYRIQGLSTKLTRTGDLRKFERNLMQRLVDCGMDTIAYLPSPANNSKLLCVVTDHGWFNVKEGVKTAEEIAAKNFDGYNINNSKDATKLLIASLDDDTARSLYENCDTLYTFASH